jgi:hypothetical protein
MYFNKNMRQMTYFHHKYKFKNLCLIIILKIAGLLLTVPNKVAAQQTNSVGSVRERTITTERPPLVGEVSANFRG